jgi:hypothetical protein
MKGQTEGKIWAVFVGWARVTDRSNNTGRPVHARVLTLRCFNCMYEVRSSEGFYLGGNQGQNSSRASCLWRNKCHGHWAEIRHSARKALRSLVAPESLLLASSMPPCPACSLRWVLLTFCPSSLQPVILLCPPSIAGIAGMSPLHPAWLQF